MVCSFAGRWVLARLESDAWKERKHRAYVGLSRSVHPIDTVVQKQRHGVKGHVTEGETWGWGLWTEVGGSKCDQGGRQRIWRVATSTRREKILSEASE
jgi:hypothetical protein